MWKLPAEDGWGQLISEIADDLERIRSQRKTLEADIQEAFFKHAPGKVWRPYAGSDPGPEPEPSPRSETHTDSKTEDGSPPMQGSPP